MNRMTTTAMVGTTLAITSLIGASPALADGPVSASRTGVSYSGYVSFFNPYDFRLSSYVLKDTGCDASSVYVEVRVRYNDNTTNTISTKTNNSGCGSTAQLADVNWHSSRGRIASVWLRACVNNSGGNDCSPGASVYNQFG